MEPVGSESARTFYEQEVFDAENVKRLKNKYLDKFFTEKKEQLYEHMANLPLGEAEALVVAHHQLKSINALEIELQTYQDSGKLAAISLDGYKT